MYLEKKQNTENTFQSKVDRPVKHLYSLTIYERKHLLNKLKNHLIPHLPVSQTAHQKAADKCTDYMD